MTDGAWIAGFPAAITVCDKDGTILSIEPRRMRILCRGRRSIPHRVESAGVPSRTCTDKSGGVAEVGIAERLHDRKGGKEEN